ncbi:molybdenum cofactor biosynthesis protein MoaE [Microbacterium sp. SORGH_AS_0888]|uniref:molybdenum cofactor biosynthesis protein MoaE n=1 Tax=Microbacterium sp. SORGH_AS_0888 TaxID=3041791 RepID=UPI0027866EC6|nr:molybdenum cofactor biosynthesis protein MoaE [Microbacterium sp. SORGH_AS_0888]MDQ1129984.1 molybdopterin synthase catalytic subunit [Microbacterium sp. SORGH_AS_0888]
MAQGRGSHDVADLEEDSEPIPVPRLAVISHGPLDIDAHLRHVEEPSIGAVVTFVGRVRDHDPDAAGAVTMLEYSAHPDAEEVLARLAVHAAGDTGVLVAVSHRVGRLAVGDLAVVIAVGAAHRAAAFDVCRTLIESIKTDLPIWKRQIQSDGTATWQGLGG